MRYFKEENEEPQINTTIKRFVRRSLNDYEVVFLFFSYLLSFWVRYQNEEFSLEKKKKKIQLKFVFHYKLIFSIFSFSLEII